MNPRWYTGLCAHELIVYMQYALVPHSGRWVFRSGSVSCGDDVSDSASQSFTSLEPLRLVLGTARGVGIFLGYC